MTPQERRAKIVELLDHWPEFFEPASSGTTATSTDGGGLPLLSSMAQHPSVVELGRCLVVLRAKVPRHYRHLFGYFDAPWRTTDQPVKRKTVGGRAVIETQRVRVRVVPAWVEARMVDRSVDMLGGLWNVREAGEPELPRPLLAKLRPLSDSDGWTEAA